MYLRGDYIMVRHYKLVSIIFMSFLVLCGNNGFAQDIKKRMKERLPVIVDLKSRGVIGENNAGLLEFIGNNREGAEIVSAENEDRLKVYEAIAKQQDTTVDKVARRRAKQIEEKADPGEWLQNDAGEWYQKK